MSGFFLLVLVLGLFVYRLPEQSFFAKPNLSPEEVELVNKFEVTSVNNAYIFYKDKYGQTPPEQAHNLGHLVGEAVFYYSGVRGVLTCDSTQNWGCSHSLMSLGLAKEGTGFITAGAELCRLESHQVGRCLDAMGHGVLYARKYQLLEALHDCDVIYKEGRQSCYNGIFKEYNDRSMRVFPSETVVRDQSQPHQPCQGLSPEYQTSCYFELPYYWVVSLNKDFVRMGQLCQEVSEGTVRWQCFGGVGRAILAGTSYNRDGSAPAKCATMPTLEARGQCIIQMVSILKNTFGEKRYASGDDMYLIPGPTSSFCEGLSIDYELECRKMVSDFKCDKLQQC